MAERDRMEQLDLALEEWLRGSAPPADAALAELVRLAADLMTLPDPGFRSELQKRFLIQKGRIPMNTMTSAPIESFAPPGFHTLTPYLIVRDAPAFLEFLKQAFGAQEKLVVPREDGSIMHAEARVGDSAVEFAEAGDGYPARPTSLHYYVRDADAIYRQALSAGGKSLFEPADREYGDRESGITDPSGNQWYIATVRGGSGRYAPEGLRDVTLYLHPKDADEMIGFLGNAFDAEVVERHANPAGRVMHARLRIGDSILELGEAHDQWQPMPAAIHMYVEDVDATYRKALEAGGISEAAPEDKPYGERAAGVRDPFGNQWFVARFLGGDRRG